MKRLLKFIFFIVILFIIISIAYKLLNSTIQIINPIKNNYESTEKYISQETILENILSEQKVVVTEITLKEKITVDNSYGNLSILKKMQNIYFVGKGDYTVDLSSVEDKDIILDDSNNTLTIILPSPKILDDNIYIDEKETSYEELKKGLLRFGDIKFTSSEYSALLTYVKEKMREKLEEKELIEKAKENTTKLVTKLILNIYKENDDIKILINFK